MGKQFYVEVLIPSLRRNSSKDMCGWSKNLQTAPKLHGICKIYTWLFQLALDGAVVMFFQFRSHVLCMCKVKFDTVSTSRKYDIVHNHLQCCDLFKLFSINHVRETSSCLCNDIESCDHNFFHCPLYFKQCLNKPNVHITSDF